MINKGNNSFEDQTQKYFPANNFKFSKMSLSDFDLKDLDGDGFLDIFPISGANDNVNNILGGYHPDTAGSHNTFFYKNYNNNYFRKISIDSFFIVKDWSNFKDLKNIDSVWKNFYLKLNSVPEIKGEYLLDDLYYLNNMYLDDFNNDKKLDLLGFKGYNNSFQSFMINKYGFNDNLKIQIGMALFTQCNLIKPTFSTSNFSICSGDSLKLSITNVNKGDSLKWYFGGKTDFTNVSNKTFTDSDKLFVTRTDSLGCTISSDTVNLVKSISPSAPTIFRDTANNLVANTYGITWYKDGFIIPDTTQKLKPSSPGSYTAKTTQNGCISPMSSPYYYLVTDIINLSKDEYIKLAPNPFQGQLNFDFVIKGYQRLNIDVYELSTGNRVKSIIGLTQGSKVDLGVLSSGTYVLRVSSIDNKISHQFKMVKL